MVNTMTEEEAVAAISDATNGIPCQFGVKVRSDDDGSVACVAVKLNNRVVVMIDSCLVGIRWVGQSWDDANAIGLVDIEDAIAFMGEGW